MKFVNLLPLSLCQWQEEDGLSTLVANGKHRLVTFALGRGLGLVRHYEVTAWHGMGMNDGTLLYLGPDQAAAGRISKPASAGKLITETVTSVPCNSFSLRTLASGIVELVPDDRDGDSGVFILAAVNGLHGFRADTSGRVWLEKLVDMRGGGKWNIVCATIPVGGHLTLEAQVREGGCALGLNWNGQHLRRKFGNKEFQLHGGDTGPFAALDKLKLA